MPHAKQLERMLRNLFTVGTNDVVWNDIVALSALQHSKMCHMLKKEYINDPMHGTCNHDLNGTPKNESAN